jgi:peptidoglycan/LPS O-acetylase OafA/YrhL
MFASASSVPAAPLPASVAEQTGFASDSDAAAPAPQPSLEPSPGRLESIDVLRGAAALAVVLCHVVSSHMSALQQARVQHPWLGALGDILGYGREGVPLFFVISGFCIHLRWARDNARLQQASPDQTAPTVPFFSFWKRRLFRLYPPYLAGLVFAMGVAWLQWKVSGRPELSFPSNRGMALDFAIHVPMLHGLHPDFDERGGNIVFWTLAREEYFYLAYFPLLWLRRSTGVVLAVCAVAILSILGPIVAQQVLASTVADPAARRLWEFPFNPVNSALALWFQWCLGMVSVEAYCARRVLPVWCRSLLLMAAWTALGVWARETKAAPFVAHAAWGLAFWTLLNAVVHAEQAGRWKPGRIGVWLAGVGAFSYSLYLVHRPLLIVWRKAELVALQKLGLAHLESAPWLLMLEWAASFLICYAAGRLFYALIERHFVAGGGGSKLAGRAR